MEKAVGYSLIQNEVVFLESVMEGHYLTLKSLKEGSE